MRHKFNARPLPVLNPNNETRRFCHFPMLSLESVLEINRDERWFKIKQQLVFWWGWTWSTPARAQSSFIACQVSYEHFSPQRHERWQIAPIGIIILFSTFNPNKTLARSFIFPLALWNPPTFKTPREPLYRFAYNDQHCGRWFFYSLRAQQTNLLCWVSERDALTKSNLKDGQLRQKLTGAHICQPIHGGGSLYFSPQEIWNFSALYQQSLGNFSVWRLTVSIYALCLVNLNVTFGTVIFLLGYIIMEWNAHLTDLQKVVQRP
jgi:hypothetical protein